MATTRPWSDHLSLFCQISESKCATFDTYHLLQITPTNLSQPLATTTSQSQLDVMSTTPKATRRKSKVTTPGDASVASAASSIGEKAAKQGVPFNIQKQFAQELEKAYPIAFCPATGNSAAALFTSSSSLQPLADFLDDIVTDDPVHNIVFGKRGDQIRRKLENLIQYWKSKDRAWYTKRVISKLGVIAEKQRKPRKKIVEDEELSASDLSDEEFALEQKPASERKKRAKDPFLGKTVTSVSKQGKAPKPTAKMTDKSTFRLLSDGTLEGKL